MSAALGRVGWRGRDTAAEGEREKGDEQEGRGEEGEAKRVRPIGVMYQGRERERWLERRKQERKGWMRIVSKEDVITGWRGEDGRGDRERCWTGLRCLGLICIFYDAPSCQSTRSHAAVPLAGSLLLCVVRLHPSHYVHLYVLVASLTVMFRIG